MGADFPMIPALHKKCSIVVLFPAKMGLSGLKR
jgi:hypothetical protein